MKKHTRIFAGISLALITAVLVVLLVYPQIAATWHGYIDINNGRLKNQYVSFGRIYQQSIKETEYSKLLKSFGFEELPANWQPANSAELGLRYILSTQRVHQKYSTLPTDTEGFASWLNQQERMSHQEQRERLEQFRALVRGGTPKQIHEYVQDLLYGHLKKEER